MRSCENESRFRIVWFHDSNEQLCGALVAEDEQYRGVLDPVVEVSLSGLMLSDTSVQYIDNTAFIDLKRSLGGSNVS